MTQPIQEPTTNRTLSGQIWTTNQLARRPQVSSGCPCPIQSAIANDGAITGTGTVLNNTLTNISFADGVSLSTGTTAFVDNSGTSTVQPIKLILDGWYIFYVDFEWSGGGYTDVRYYALTLTVNADNDGNTSLGANESAPVEASFHRPYGPLYFRATSLQPKIGLAVKQTSSSTQTITGVLLTAIYMGPDSDPARFPPF